VEAQTCLSLRVSKLKIIYTSLLTFFFPRRLSASVFIIIYDYLFTSLLLRLLQYYHLDPQQSNDRCSRDSKELTYRVVFRLMQQRHPKHQVHDSIGSLEDRYHFKLVEVRHGHVQSQHFERSGGKSDYPECG